jgi:hypothetical protein
VNRACTWYHQYVHRCAGISETPLTKGMLTIAGKSDLILAA